MPKPTSAAEPSRQAPQDEQAARIGRRIDASHRRPAKLQLPSRTRTEQQPPKKKPEEEQRERQEMRAVNRMARYRTAGPAEARRLGALAASAFGAGFGGSVWALSRAEEAEALREKWEAAYLQAFPARSGVATFFVMAPGPGACCV